MEERILRDLIQAVSRVEREMIRRGYAYPRGSNFFTSSIPHDIESKEEIANYFRNELQKLSIVSQKLMYWLEEFEENELRDYEIGMPNEAELNDSYRNLTIPELHLFYQPINPRTQKVYSVRMVREWFKNNPTLQPVVRLGGRRYSRRNFERFLQDGGIQYNQELTNELFEYVNSEECSDLPTREVLRRVSLRIRDHNNRLNAQDVLRILNE